VRRLKNLAKSITVTIVLSLTLSTTMWEPAIAKASTVSEDTYSSNSSSDLIIQDRYDEELQSALAAYNQELLNEKHQLKNFSTNAQPAIIGSLIRLIFKQLVSKQTGKAASSVVVKATNKNVTTKITAHAIEEAVKDGITSLIVNNVLSEISSGIFKVEKFEDPIGKTRIMADRNNKTVIILDYAANTIITIYKDSKLDGSTIDSRVNSGRWVRSNFKYKN